MNHSLFLNNCRPFNSFYFKEIAPQDFKISLKRRSEALALPDSLKELLLKIGIVSLPLISAAVTYYLMKSDPKSLEKRISDLTLENESLKADLQNTRGNLQNLQDKFSTCANFLLGFIVLAAAQVGVSVSLYKSKKEKEKQLTEANSAINEKVKQLTEANLAITNKDKTIGEFSELAEQAVAIAKENKRLISSLQNEREQLTRKLDQIKTTNESLGKSGNKISISTQDIERISNHSDGFIPESMNLTNLKMQEIIDTLYWDLTALIDKITGHVESLGTSSADDINELEGLLQSVNEKGQIFKDVLKGAVNISKNQIKFDDPCSENTQFRHYLERICSQFFLCEQNIRELVNTVLKYSRSNDPGLLLKLNFPNLHGVTEGIGNLLELEQKTNQSLENRINDLETRINQLNNKISDLEEENATLDIYCRESEKSLTKILEEQNLHRPVTSNEIDVICNFSKDSQQNTYIPKIDRVRVILENEFSELSRLVRKIQKHNRDLNEIKSLLQILNRKGSTCAKLLQGAKNILTQAKSSEEERANFNQFLEEQLKLLNGYKQTIVNLIQQMKSDSTFDGMNMSGSLSSSLLNLSLPPQTPIDAVSLAPSPADLKSSNDLVAFCNYYCQGISLQEARRYIESGRQLLQKILSKEVTPSQDPQASQEELTALSWFLTWCAIQKEQGHEEGAFMIEDPQERLYGFLQGSPGYNHGERLSSHLIGRTPPKSFGVDVVNERLPSGKRTILFAQALAFPENGKMPEADPKKVLFFKLENFSTFPSTGFYDASMHLWELIVSKKTKLLNPKLDDLPHMRKERVPSDAMEAFKALIAKLGEAEKENGIKALEEDFEDLYISGNKEDEILELKEKAQTSLENGKEGLEKLNLQEAKSNAARWGLAYMYYFVNNYNISDQAENEANALRAILKNYDHIQHRTGREVYLDSNEISEFLAKPVLQESETAKLNKTIEEFTIRCTHLAKIKSTERVFVDPQGILRSLPKEYELLQQHNDKIVTELSRLKQLVTDTFTLVETYKDHQDLKRKLGEILASAIGDERRGLCAMKNTYKAEERIRTSLEELIPQLKSQISNDTLKIEELSDDEKVSEQDDTQTAEPTVLKKMVYNCTLLYNHLMCATTWDWQNEIKSFKNGASLHLGILPSTSPWQDSFEYFKKNKIEAVLCVTEQFENNTSGLVIQPITPNMYHDKNIEHKQLECEDYKPIKPEILDEGVEFVKKNIDAGKSVYVHCKAGRGRSAMIVAGYLIKYHDYDSNSVVEFLKSKRAQVKISENQKKSLGKYAYECRQKAKEKNNND